MDIWVAREAGLSLRVSVWLKTLSLRFEVGVVVLAVEAVSKDAERMGRLLVMRGLGAKAGGRGRVGLRAGRGGVGEIV